MPNKFKQKIDLHIRKLIADKKETVAESLCMMYMDLLYHYDKSVILVPTHSVTTKKMALNTIHRTLGLAASYPFSKIYIITHMSDPYYYIYNRFNHYTGVFKMNRLQDISELITVLGVTKLYHPHDTNWNIRGPLLSPSIIIRQEDTIHNIVYQPNAVIINCNYTQQKQKNILKDKIRTIPHNKIICTDTIVPGIRCPQLTINGYTHSGKQIDFVNSTSLAISVLIGALLNHTYMSYIPKEDTSENIFDFIYMCFKN